MVYKIVIMNVVIVVYFVKVVLVIVDLEITNIKAIYKKLYKLIAKNRLVDYLIKVV